MIVVALVEYFIIALLFWGILPTLGKRLRPRVEITLAALWPFYLTWGFLNYARNQVERYMDNRVQ